MYDTFKSFAFALGEDTLVEEHEAELDQAQTRYLHQLDRPQDLDILSAIERIFLDDTYSSYFPSRLLLIRCRVQLRVRACWFRSRITGCMECDACPTAMSTENRQIFEYIPRSADAHIPINKI